MRNLVIGEVDNKFHIGDEIWVVTILASDSEIVFNDEFQLRTMPEAHRPDRLRVRRCIITGMSITASPLAELNISFMMQDDDTSVDLPVEGVDYDNDEGGFWCLPIANIDISGYNSEADDIFFRETCNDEHAENLKWIFGSKDEAIVARDAILKSKIPVSELYMLSKKMLKRVAKHPELLDLTK